MSVRSSVGTVLRTIVHTFRVDFARKQVPYRVYRPRSNSLRNALRASLVGGLDARDNAIHGTSYPRARGRLERARRGTRTERRMRSRGVGRGKSRLAGIHPTME